MVELLRCAEITPLECLDALEARIADVDGVVHALPTLCLDRAREHAQRLMRQPVGERGLLCGLPVAIKDLTEVAGVRTTYGSPAFAEFVPDFSDPLVERLESNGGVVYAKSNTPEFGAGGNTFNEVFPPTLNPWNLERSAAGSSGGAAAALACGTAWLAHGSDLGGSLRNPASFCGVVGMRPSPGRVAAAPRVPIDDLLGIDGPMARCVDDVALFLDAMAGEDIRNPVSLPKPAVSFTEAARDGWMPRRVAFSADLGITPVDPEVAEICRSAASRFEELGAAVDETHPDMSEAHDTFQVLRARGFVSKHGPLYRRSPELLKPEVRWNIERGLALSVADLDRAERQRAAMYARTVDFFGRYDLLLTPATIVAAYPVEQRYLGACDGHTFETYIDWLAIAYAITLVACPALSLPCGFTGEGLPIGLQIVAAPRADDRLLAAARALEGVLGVNGLTPIDPRPAP